MTQDERNFYCAHLNVKAGKVEDNISIIKYEIDKIKIPTHVFYLYFLNHKNVLFYVEDFVFEAMMRHERITAKLAGKGNFCRILYAPEPGSFKCGPVIIGRSPPEFIQLQ